MAITYGMSVKEFWEDNPDLFWAYRFSYYKKNIDNQELLNYKAWLHGAYIYEALMISLGNCFGKEKNNYPLLPYGIDKKDNKSKENEVDLQVADIKARIKQVNAIKSK